MSFLVGSLAGAVATGGVSHSPTELPMLASLNRSDAGVLWILEPDTNEVRSKAYL